MKNLHKINENIYITSDEEIKEGDWVLLPSNEIYKMSSTDITHYLESESKSTKKIILTDNKDLIKDGVQVIDDEFLEWFVKNPSCEEVEIIKTAPIRPFGSLYKVIIPKPTQQIIDKDFDGGLTMGQIIPKEETICIQTGLPCGMTCFSEEVCNRNVYTEEDVKNAFLDGWQLRDGDLPFPKAKKKWFNEFKNK
jgi:hypothetical protein